MRTEEIVDLCKQHTMFTWAARDAVDPLPVERTDGVYMYTTDGKAVLDFNSQLMSVNIGHNHPKVVAAVKEQADKGLFYTYPGTATEPRARLAKLLAEITPGDINTFLFTLGGAEANENAIRAAKLYTGRSKILARYRSYHGATNACMQLTGDPRRWANEPGMPGVVHVMDPQPYHYSFGEDEATRTARNLEYLDEVIMYEGPQTIAAMIIEPVTGTNGILPPPAGYLQGLRQLLDKHGILLICDEVMAGFGRTGKLFAFEHGGIVPDIVSMAKGLTSSYVPLGAVGLADPIAEHFRTNVFWGGLTYNSHAFCCAVAEATVRVLLDEGLVERSAEMGKVMRGHMERLQEKHPSLGAFRQIGLFGMLDLVKNSEGELISGYNKVHPKVAELIRFFRDEGLFTFVRWSHVMCNPPLIISEEDLAKGFEIIDRGLEITDSVYEG